jgi:hypothetical protein
MKLRLAMAAVVGAVISLGLTLGVQEVVAQGSGTTYYACLKAGLLTKVGTAPPTCGSKATSISWDQQGPQGPSGVSHAYTNDPVGQAITINGDTTATVASVSVPSGSYSIDAQVDVGGPGPYGSFVTITCSLWADQTQVALAAPITFDEYVWDATIPLVASVPVTSTVTVQCQTRNEGTQSPPSAAASISAIAIDAIN